MKIVATQLNTFTPVGIAINIVAHIKNNSATKGDDGEVDTSTGGHGTGGSNGYAIVTNQGSAPSITGGGSITGRTATSTNPT